MHDLSYKLKNVFLPINEFRVSVEVFTFDNVFTADPEKTVVTENGIFAEGLLTFGGQKKASGSLSLVKNDDGYALQAHITEMKIRCIKLAIDGLPQGFVDGTIDCKMREVDDFGFVLHYPEGWRELATPCAFLNTSSGAFYFYSEDDKVREKRFAFMRREGRIRAELIFEEDATAMTSSIAAPVWRFGFTTDKDEVKSKYAEFIVRSHNLKPYEKRCDSPTWLSDISLVVAAHCMHWTGYVFNTYSDIVEALKYITSKIEGKHVLLYLPGFEGRYYFDYGTYSPAEALGGKEGLQKLINAAHEMGVHVMLMFGINVVSTESEGYAQWGIPSLFVPAAGGVCNHLDCDMDSSRHYHHGSQGIVNPAAPGWQNRLVDQIVSLREEFGYDGAFLDIAAVWVNDSNFPLFEGIKKLCSRLREGAPEFLISGEAWYDGLSECIPLFHSGHTFGEMHYHDEFNEKIFTPYAREFAHLCLGDPSRHSTGVHELGTNHIWRAPVRRGVIPTLTIVDGSIKHGRDGVDAIIADACEYREKYIN